MAADAPAQDKKFPSRPVDMIVNFGPGGGADQLGRVMSKLLEPVLGVPMPVANVAGASGNAGLTKVLTSTPDGYTIGTLTGLPISAWASGLGKMQVSDFAYRRRRSPRRRCSSCPQDSKIQNYQELLEAAKATPGKLRVATAGYGTLDDIAVKFLGTKGFPMVNVPFAKPGERYAVAARRPQRGAVRGAGRRRAVPRVEAVPADRRVRRQASSRVSRHAGLAEFGHHIDLPNWRAS